MRRRGRITLRVAALVCVVGAGALVFVSRPDASGASAGAATPPVRTPLFSPRRVPGIWQEEATRVARARADAALQARLAAIVGPSGGCVAVNVDGRAVARVNDAQTFAPASTLKLATAVVALNKFGTEHRFRTNAVRAGNDLVIVGGGDPLLATDAWIEHEHAKPQLRDAAYTSLDAFADAIVAAGVKQVPGALVVDDSRHESLRFVPDWDEEDRTDGEIGSLGALTVDSGFSDPARQTPASDPALLTGARLRELLIARGVTIAGPTRRGVAPAGARSAAHIDSPPLREVLREMLQGSDNYTAEEVLREIAVNPAQHQVGTTDLGHRIVAHELTALGVPVPGIDLRDGSGLSHHDRVRCSTVLDIVALTHQPKFAAVASALPVAGRSGTLIGRFLGDPLAGHLRAKTGTLTGVVGLAGSIDTGARPDFAFIANGPFSTGGGQQLQVEIADAVAAYPVVSAPPNLVPPP